MEATIKVLHMMNKVTKEGNPYKEYVCLVTINGREWIQSFRDFPKGE